jgi:hypothetical protein
VVAADLDGDGSVDLASSDVAVLLGNGDGSFQDLRLYDTGFTGTNGVTANDCNGDGKLDLVAVGDFFEPGVSVLLSSPVPGPPPGTVAEAIDQPAATVLGGGVPWFFQTKTSHDTVDAAQSGDILDRGISVFALEATGPGTVSFWWKVSSEHRFDVLRFYIDGIDQGGGISGEVDWVQRSFELGSGSHTLQWMYSKDSDVSEGFDCGWVDQLVLPNGATPLEAWRQTYFGSPANTGNGADTADPDKDGLNNLLEFAFGLHPLQPSPSQPAQWQREGNSLTCTFTQPAGVSGISYGAEWSPSMAPGTWQTLPDTATPPQHAFSTPIDSNTKKFVRLRVTAP